MKWSMRMSPTKKKVSTDNAETMPALVKLAVDMDESASYVVVYGMVR